LTIKKPHDERCLIDGAVGGDDKVKEVRDERNKKRQEERL